MTRTIKIGNRTVGDGHSTFVIAEVGMNHEGSLGMAHAFIDAFADAGADCVKFQTRIAEAESTLDEVFRVPLTSQDPTRFSYWKRMQFTEDQWRELAAHAAKRSIGFLSTAFSIEAVEMLARVGVPAWKVGSGEFAFFDMLDAMAAHRKPILLSTGMSSWQEIATAAERLRARDAEFGLFQCTSRYPLAMNEVGLEVIGQLAERFACPSGLSDHSGSLHPGLAAMARGAHMLEVHVTLDKRAFGPDVSSSITVDELSVLTKARDAFHEMISNPVDKDRTAQELQPMRRLFMRSLAPIRALPAGTVLERAHLSAKRPGSGIPISQVAEIVGRRLKRAVGPERLLVPEDLE